MINYYLCNNVIKALKMDNDLVSLLIYVVMIVIAVVVSAYQADKKKKQGAGGRLPGQSQQSSPQPDEPVFDPFRDLFDHSEQSETTPVYTSIEEGPSVESGGTDIERSEKYEGMSSLTIDGANKTEAPEPAEIDNYIEASAMDEIPEIDYDENFIKAGEIVSEEASNLARTEIEKNISHFDIRKAIIYSEILKRKEF